MKKVLRDLANTFHRTSNWGKYYNTIARSYSEELLNDLQNVYIEKLLLHSYKNVPYYRRVFNEIGLVKNDKVDLSKFNQIPILTKDIIRKEGEKLYSNDIGERKWYYNSSGGSTGEPVSFIQDHNYTKWGKATFQYWYKHFLGIDEQNAIKIILWGSEMDLFKKRNIRSKVGNWLNNTVFLNSFNMSYENMKNYVNKINQYKPIFIRGYAGSLYDLSNFIKENDLKVYSPKLIVSAAETLRNHVKERIQDVFKTRVYNFYGSREASCLAGECNMGNMHIYSFNNIIEVLDDGNKPVDKGQEGRIIVTNLHNYSMPLIRYQIEDMGIWGGYCDCGLPTPILLSITGRITEHFSREDGSSVSGSALTLTFNLFDWVKEFQIIQEDYKKIRMLIVKKAENDLNDQKKIEDKIKILLGEDCSIIWDFVDNIPRTPQGKYVYIRSLIRR